MATFRKRNDKWEFTVYTGELDSKGKRERLYKGGFKTKKEAEKAAALLMAKIENGTYFKVDKITFDIYMEKFLNSIKTQLANKTYTTYEYIANKHLIPYFGKLELSRIKAIHIQEFYTESLKKVSSTTVRHFHNLLNKAFNQAIKWQIVNINPCLAVDKPKRTKTELKVYDEVQVNKLLERLKDMMAYYPTMLAVTTGMRLGEICGLTWDKVDLENGIIYVEKQLQKVDGSLELLPLKTESSKRKIILLDYTIKELKQLNIEQKENKLKYGEYYQETNFVVCQKKTGLPYDPEYISRNHLKVMKDYGICKELDIPYIRFHDLRHTHATLMLKANINPKIVAERLGHSSVNLTLNTYSHVLPDMQKEAVNKLNNIMSK